MTVEVEATLTWIRKLCAIKVPSTFYLKNLPETVADIYFSKIWFSTHLIFLFYYTSTPREYSFFYFTNMFWKFL